MHIKLVLFIFALYCAQSFAQTTSSSSKRESLFEAGAGAVYASVPHYPGSDQSNALLVPFPTLIYRGDKYRVDEDGGARARFFYTDMMEVNLSIGGSLPVSTKDSKIRQGMPKLDTIIELGPGLIVHFFNKRNAKGFKLSLNIPIRQAISSDLKYTKARGQVFNPLLYGFYDLNKHFTLVGGLSNMWATKEYTSYLYDVADRFATSNRASYHSSGGQVVSNYSLAVVYSNKNLSLFTGSIFHDASRSSNKDSPLFVKSTNWSHAIGLTYFFYELL
tara:strand:- start:9036 stop:9860 length:825 start_codon:yes stop_codon:yes gene_type:complete